MFATKFAAVAAFALPLFFQSAVADSCTRTYTIKDGDVCDSISAANNVSTYQLAMVNTGIINSDCSNLTPGNTICLGTQGEDCSTTYVVQAQDTCETINSNHGINSTVLYGNNAHINSDCSNVYVGEVLCVASTIAAPPAGSVMPTAIPTTATAAESATPTVAALAASSTASSDDGDDEDLPYCDEL